MQGDCDLTTSGHASKFLKAIRPENMHPVYHELEKMMLGCWLVIAVSLNPAKLYKCLQKPMVISKQYACYGIILRGCCFLA